MSATRKKPWICSRCPKFRDAYCAHYAKFVSAFAPACELGHRLIHNENSRRWMAAHRKPKKAEEPK